MLLAMFLMLCIFFPLSSASIIFLLVNIFFLLINDLPFFDDIFQVLFLVNVYIFFAVLKSLFIYFLQFSKSYSDHSII